MNALPAPDLPTVAVVYGLGSAGPAAVLRAARALCEIVFVCDIAVPGVAPLLPGIRRQARVCEISGMDIREAAEVLRAERPDAVVTFSEFCLGATAQLAEILGLPGHRPETVRLLTDKTAQRAALAAAGVDDTPTLEASSAAGVLAAVELLGHPVVVKPRVGAGSRDTLRLDGAEQHGRLAEIMPDGDERVFVVEKYLPGDPSAAGERWGDYVSVEAVVVRGEVRTICVTGKFALADPLRETGLFLPSTLSSGAERDVAALAAAAVRALGVRTGVTHTEVKLTPDGPRVIEVNGRVGGRAADLLRRAHGVDLLATACELALGRDVEPAPSPSGAVAFEYFIVPPRLVGVLRSIDGADAVRAMPGVREVDVVAAPGQPVDWRFPAQRLGFVRGEVKNHDSLHGLIMELDKKFHLEYAVQ